MTNHLQSVKCIKRANIKSESEPMQIILQNDWKNTKMRTITTTIITNIFTYISQKKNAKLHDKIFIKVDFKAQLKRWIVIIKNLFRIVEHIETVQLFQCLNENVDFSSVNIIKNHIMKRLAEIEKQLFKHLFNDDIKVSLILNGWATFNKQSYLEMIAFFIDNDWRYHDVLIDFENVLNRHFDSRLTIIVRGLLQKYNIKNRLNVVITNNANNNKIFFENLIKWLKNKSKVVELTHNVDLDYEINLSRSDNENMQHIFYLTHVLQLIFKALLDHVRIKSTNEDLQKIWNEDENAYLNKYKGLFLILTKMSFCNL